MDYLPNHLSRYRMRNNPKDEMLRLIEDMIRVNDLKPNPAGYYYDFDIPDAPRTYGEKLKQVISPIIKKMVHERYNSRIINRSKYWFHQYPPNTEFGWHTHPWCNLAVVYYVELPEGASTMFSDGRVDAKEGDVIMFPAFLPHRSPKQNSGRKTIISYNIDISYKRR